ncbi:ELWxxDGT repeat protein [Myxococcus sp. RHSTA-1-4]|uniref:ELWxxDGT repeat protein n=1 Tax=Myxococcus sp. RHSTA-1-4 TaxID=2874601 RepID=UPI0021081F43|nr:ELWxxDGT repeat protein [Myxococcus sp. RHSTA-1-4]MBZ4420242.1 hypothetical protein [Myxococcus sp. RHSTA-1-4]
MKRRGGTVSILVSTVSAMALAGCGGGLEVASEGEGLADTEAGETEAAEERRWEPCSLEPERVKDIYRGAASSNPTELTHADGTLLFAADDGAHGRELWKSSGTQGPGTKKVKDIRPGPAGSDPELLTRVGDTVFFTADDGTTGRELWKTDGTRSGTKRVKDIYPGPAGSEPESLIEFNGLLYFAADDGVHGREVWRSDGTPGGTFMVRDLTTEPGAENRSFEMAVAGDYLYIQYYVATPDLSIADLVFWSTDGTAAGFEELIRTGEDNTIDEMTEVGGRLFFSRNIDEPDEYLYVSDGTAAGTVSIRRFPGPLNGLTEFKGKLYFASGHDFDTAPPDYRGDELWKSDGTLAGTVMVKDIRPGAEDSSPRGLVASNGYLYFSADDGVHGREPWRSDGTTAGTVLLKDVEPGATGSSPEELTAIYGWLFFSAETSGHGREPWVSNGTTAGTVPLEEIAPGAASSNPRDFVRSGWDVFFSAENARKGRELYALPFRPEGECNGDDH